MEEKQYSRKNIYIYSKHPELCDTVEVLTSLRAKLVHIFQEHRQFTKVREVLNTISSQTSE